MRTVVYEFGPFRLDREARLLLKDGIVVPLTLKVLELLLVLVEKSGQLVTKDELIKAVWPDTFVEESNLTSNISILRKQLGAGSSGDEYVQTIPKRGYRFVAVVKRREDNQGIDSARGIPHATDSKPSPKRKVGRTLVAGFFALPLPALYLGKPPLH